MQLRTTQHKRSVPTISGRTQIPMSRDFKYLPDVRRNAGGKQKTIRRIVELGKGVLRWKEGDRVIADACIVCGECYYCKKGMSHLGKKLGFNGLTADGGFAEYVIVQAYQLHKLDERMGFEEGAFIEPISVGVYAVRKGCLMEGYSSYYRSRSNWSCNITSSKGSRSNKGLYA